MAVKRTFRPDSYLNKDLHRLNFFFRIFTAEECLYS